MMDYEKARIKMVDCQVRTCDVTEHEILSSMMTVPREEFVPKKLRDLAYIDEDLSLDNGRFLMEPAPFAKLLQIAKIDDDDVALVIGAGCGYSSAVISLMASSVVAVEEDKQLADEASARLTALGYDNVAFVKGQHALGYAKEGPYDVIFIDGAVEYVPDALTNQLSEQGRLVSVEGIGNSGLAMVYEKTDGIVSSRSIDNCAVKPLPGFEKKQQFVF